MKSISSLYDKFTKKLVDFLLPKLSKKYTPEECNKKIQGVMTCIVSAIFILFIYLGKKYTSSLNLIIFGITIILGVVFFICFVRELISNTEIFYHDYDSTTFEYNPKENEQDSYYGRKRLGWRNELETIPGTGHYRDKFGNEYDFNGVPVPRSVEIKGDKK